MIVSHTMKKKKPLSTPPTSPNPPAPLEVEASVAWYGVDQWRRLRELADDAHTLHDSYAAWEASALQSLAYVHRRGIRAQPIAIDVEAWAHWCREQNLPLTARSRSQFAAKKAAEREAVSGGEQLNWEASDGR